MAIPQRGLETHEVLTALGIVPLAHEKLGSTGKVIGAKWDQLANWG